MRKLLLTLLSVACAVVSAEAQSKKQVHNQDNLVARYDISPERIISNKGGIDLLVKSNDKDEVSQDVAEVKNTATRHSEHDSESQPRQTTNNSQLKNNNYYAGAGAGTSLVTSSFGGIGVGAQIFGGVEFSRLISAELSLGYSIANMTAFEDCENLYYAGGKRYYAPVAGVKSYRYADMKSAVNIISLGAKVNFDILSILNSDTPWGVLLSPKVGMAYSTADIKSAGAKIGSGTATHFSTGLDVAGAYRLNDKWGLRLTFGADYLSGKGIDAMPQSENKPNYILASLLSVTYKF